MIETEFRSTKNPLNKSQDLTPSIQITKIDRLNQKKPKIWRSSDKSDKSMDLMKSTSSEDLPTDLHRKSEDFPPKMWGFHELNDVLNE